MQAHDFQLSQEYNTVIVSVTNSEFPAIPDMSPEERQQRAENDELSTVEFPIFILDNASTSDKITEWNRTKTTPYAEHAVHREDFRVTVSEILSVTS